MNPLKPVTARACPVDSSVCSRRAPNRRRVGEGRTTFSVLNSRAATISLACSERPARRVSRSFDATTLPGFVDATPLVLLREDLAGKALIYSTTNGTVSLRKVKDVACRPFARSPPVAAPRAGPHRLGPNAVRDASRSMAPRHASTGAHWRECFRG